MSKRSKSRNEQRKPSGKEQKPKIAASEAPAAVKREYAPIARAPQTPAPKTPAPKATPPAPMSPRAAASPEKPAPKAPAPKATPPAPVPPRAAASPEKPAPKTPTPKATPPAPAAAAPSPEPPQRVLEIAVETMERSLKAAGQGTVAVNRKLIDFAQANLSSSLDLARSLACARNPMQVMHLQVTYWDERMKVLASQAEELRALSAEIVAKANEPIREHMRRSLKARAA
ncbi:MAG: phasin family protein [Methyloceanibacter sp.]